MNLNVVFEQFPVLESGEIVLMKIEDSHLDAMYEIYSNSHVFHFCGIIPMRNKVSIAKMIGNFERDYNKRTKIKWGIFLKNSGESPIGIIEAFGFDQKINMVTIGYFLAELHWGKGIAAKAVSAVVKYFFEEVGINRIQAEVMLLNERSKRVLMKNGFVHEGTIRQAALWTGKGIIDLDLFSILRADYSN
ncbi:GNAT family N-acetyltransferase [Paenibacillus solisilvae]|uniref:GNAT family N-acetyltransferase n=1 Tax=Paenibacillus solisilvae TaxID=2486751 RepID=A0ABW0VTP4_9BACL